MKKNNTPCRHAILGAFAAILATAPAQVLASSHMDAPLIVLDPAANTTDVYAFVTQRNNVKYLSTALAVYPFEEPGIGPNKYNFDDNVLYQIHVGTGANLSKGKPTVSYQFRFETTYKNSGTIAQSFLGPVEQVDDANQNLTQRFTLTKVDRKKRELLTDAVVPPNNQGLVTRYYNQADSGENPAREGVAASAALDRYTAASIHTTPEGYLAFAGQRDDGFYADIQSIFDLDFSFGGPNKPFDSQGGYNVHTIVLNIPVSELGGDMQSVGVWATTSRPRMTVLRSNGAPRNVPSFVQVGRQGNPLFCEAFVAVAQKDAYNRQTPATDTKSFQQFALNPELGAILGLPEAQRTNRTDLAGIFIPDYIKIDLSTEPARLAGGSAPGAAPNDAGFHRLGIFGGDVLTSAIQPGFGNGAIPGGWPNGRRFGDDVLDIAVVALLSDLRTTPPTVFDPDGPQGPLTSADANIDRVQANDIGYNKVFPYAATPLNGRNHSHH